MPTIADKFGKASVNTDYAVATTVKTTRVIGGTVLEAFDLSKFAADAPVFFITYKKTTDPVTGIVSVTNQISWKALVNAGANTLTNLTLAPGYTDSGNAIGDFVECIPTSYWGNSLIDGILVHSDQDGTLKAGVISSTVQVADGVLTNAKMSTEVKPVTLMNETTFAHVASGLVWSGDAYASTRNASMTTGIVFINGQRLVVALVTARPFTASKDTYIDILNTAGVASVVYTEAVNNAASPALAANSIRVGIIVTGATTIAAIGSINQGEPSRLLPIAGIIPYQVTDSLGNLICPRDPNRNILGYRQGGAAMSNATYIDLAPFNLVCNIPANRKVKISFYSPQAYVTALSTTGVQIVDVTAGSVTVQDSNQNMGNSAAQPIKVESPLLQPGGGVRNYKIQVKSVSGTLNLPATTIFMVELV